MKYCSLFLFAFAFLACDSIREKAIYEYKVTNLSTRSLEIRYQIPDSGARAMHITERNSETIYEFQTIDQLKANEKNFMKGLMSLQVLDSGEVVYEQNPIDFSKWGLSELKPDEKSFKTKAQTIYSFTVTDEMVRRN